QRVGLCRVAGGGEVLEGLRASFHRGGLHAPAIQQRFQNVAAGGVVVHDQNSYSRQDLVWCSSADDRVFRGFQLDGKVELTAPAHFAFHPHFAAHEGCQARADGEAETGSAILAGGGRIRLGKWLKDRLSLLRGAANGGIGNRK